MMRHYATFVKKGLLKIKIIENLDTIFITRVNIEVQRIVHAI